VGINETNLKNKVNAVPFKAQLVK